MDVEVPEKIQTAVIHGAEIQYSDRGDGEPLVLVHGGVFADWFRPMAVSRALDGFRVIRVRRAGYGHTTPAAHVSIHEHARHLAGLVASLQMARVHLAGHSSGALIALQCAADHPAIVQTLTLMESAPLGPFQVPAFAELGQRFIGPAIAAFSEGDLPGAIEKFLLGVCGPGYEQIIERRLGSDVRAAVLREASFFFKDEIPAAMQWQFGNPDAARVTCPVLVVEGAAGRRTGLLSRQVTEAALTIFPSAEVALIQNTNHLLPLQDPDAVARAVADFIRRHRLAAVEETQPSIA